jgi:hypothetical protein
MMKDVIVVVMTFGFFAVCVAYVALCDRIVGADDPVTEPAPESAPGAAAVPTEVAG